MTHTRLIATFGFLALTISSAHAQNLLTNGSFESSSGTALTTLPGWTVSTGNVDVNTTWQQFSGPNALDLNGNTQGVVRQTFNTISGRTYVLTFGYSRNPAAASATGSLTVTGASTLTSDTLISNGAVTSTAMNWQTKGYSFVANSTLTSVQFSSSTAGAAGIALDAVSVVGAPEPGALTLGLLGLLPLAIKLRRRAL
jgi:hypothetical protein